MTTNTPGNSTHSPALPTGVKVAAWIAIVVFAIGLLNEAIRISQGRWGSYYQGSGWTTTFVRFMVIQIAILRVLFFACSIGLLARAEWARRSFIVLLAVFWIDIVLWAIDGSLIQHRQGEGICAATGLNTLVIAVSSVLLFYTIRYFRRNYVRAAFGKHGLSESSASPENLARP